MGLGFNRIFGIYGSKSGFTDLPDLICRKRCLAGFTSIFSSDLCFSYCSVVLLPLPRSSVPWGNRIKRKRPTFINNDSLSPTTEFVVSPNGPSKKKIKSWMRGNRLGSGSFGTVYEGMNDDGTFIAVKEVSLLDIGNNAQQCIDQLEQEIALLSQFEHENIVQYYGTDKDESKLCIFLELVPLGSLASLYGKYPLRDTQVSSYTRQILNGLNYLHERNVVHRDIKCANILVQANGSIKLADFGVAKKISKFNDMKSCKGSVYWMAPEVINSEKTYGRAADIWSLGCTVLEMLTHQIPYPNMEWQQAALKILRGDQPNIPRDLSSDAQDFIRRCVQVDPNARPTAAQLLEHSFVMRRPLNLSQAQSLSQFESIIFKSLGLLFPKYWDLDKISINKV